MPAIVCPKCGGAVWDNRGSKTNPKQPDFKCKNRACEGVIWPPRQQRAPQPPPPKAIGPEHGDLPGAPMENAAPAPDTGNERLQRIFKVQEVCFKHALKLSVVAEAAGVAITLEGVSALTAQALIAWRDGR